jgi:hypothetical protein
MGHLRNAQAVKSAFLFQLLGFKKAIPMGLAIDVKIALESIPKADPRTRM